MPKNESKIDLAVLRIDIPEDGKPVISVPEPRTKLACPNCNGESFTGYSNDYGLHRVCTTCRFEMDMGGGYMDPKDWFGAPIAPQSPSKEQLEADEADRIAEIKMNDRYSGANRNFWSGWEADDYYNY